MTTQPSFSAGRCARILLTLGCFLVFVTLAVAQTPAVGAAAPGFTLATPAGTSIVLSQVEGEGTTVLVVLRGYPGYQCPFCVKQVHDFVEHAAEFAAQHASVLFVYPGPPADLDAHAKEFLARQQAELPANIRLVIDPDYKVTNLYGLRWDAPHETAYPSTFVLAKGGAIRYEKISHVHGERIAATEVLAMLPRL